MPVARSRCGVRLPVGLVRLPMGGVRLPVGVLRLSMACRLPLAVLLALLGAVLLGEIGDTLANPMGAFGQRVLTALHLGLDLLAERPIGSGCCRPGAKGGHRYDRCENRHGRFALDRCRQCGYASGCHVAPRFMTSPAH
jgi:hypothetical protein